MLLGINGIYEAGFGLTSTFSQGFRFSSERHEARKLLCLLRFSSLLPTASLEVPERDKIRLKALARQVHENNNAAGVQRRSQERLIKISASIIGGRQATYFVQKTAVTRHEWASTRKRLQIIYWVI
jgi:hypothetical protein